MKTEKTRLLPNINGKVIQPPPRRLVLDSCDIGVSASSRKTEPAMFRYQVEVLQPFVFANSALKLWKIYRAFSLTWVEPSLSASNVNRPLTCIKHKAFPLTWVEPSLSASNGKNTNVPRASVRIRYLLWFYYLAKFILSFYLNQEPHLFSFSYFYIFIFLNL